MDSPSDLMPIELQPDYFSLIENLKNISKNLLISI